MKQFHLIVSGRVQGVGFRYFVQTLALENHITGWVRNKADGTVECIAIAPLDTLHAFVEKIKKGNRFIKVQHIAITESEPKEPFSIFKVIY
ncbi:acylphosphatase [Niallia sp. Sow4_A1]|jgi:acylphosphatase|uniref:acylphosphatase n=1 Tax=Bacillaceae TaxID=186817 RepID=UPI0004E270DC|nr:MULTISPECIES: acylphosphatase [Bacillaceae]MCM3361158.1 acylphosphatase [Niallia sp. MER TA 168]CAI9390368.1 Acylphosphatase [Bacillus sp. T2.9-1]